MKRSFLFQRTIRKTLSEKIHTLTATNIFNIPLMNSASFILTMSCALLGIFPLIHSSKFLSVLEQVRLSSRNTKICCPILMISTNLDRFMADRRDPAAAVLADPVVVPWRDRSTPPRFDSKAAASSRRTQNARTSYTGTRRRLLRPPPFLSSFFLHNVC